MTKYIDKNWAKWEANIAPVLAEAEDEEKQMANRRATLKMNPDDPDVVISNSFQSASPQPFNAAQPSPEQQPDLQQFSHLP